MDENNRASWSLERRVAHSQELAERRAAWEAQREEEAALRERREKQARLEAWLTSRRQAWLDHTGSLPTSTTVEMWTHEYVADLLAAEEAARAERLAEAEDAAAG